MKRLCTKTWAKVLAYILFIVLTAASFACVKCYRNAVAQGLFQSGASFETTMGQSYAGSCLYYIKDYVEWTGDAANSGAVTGYCGESFSYTLSTASGRLLADTRTAQSKLSVSGVEAVYGDTIYLLDGYINMPPSPYGGCYAEYTIYQFLIGLKNWFLPLAALCALLAAAMAAFLIVSAGRGREGFARRALHRLPPEAYALLCLLWLPVTEWLRYAGFWYALPGFSTLSGWLLPNNTGAFGALTALVTAAMGVAARLRTGGLWQGSWLGRLLRRMSPIARTIAAFLVFSLVDVLLTA